MVLARVRRPKGWTARFGHEVIGSSEVRPLMSGYPPYGAHPGRTDLAIRPGRRKRGRFAIRPTSVNATKGNRSKAVPSYSLLPPRPWFRLAFGHSGQPRYFRLELDLHNRLPVNASGSKLRAKRPKHLRRANPHLPKHSRSPNNPGRRKNDYHPRNRNVADSSRVTRVHLPPSNEAEGRYLKTPTSEG